MVGVNQIIEAWYPFPVSQIVDSCDKKRNYKSVKSLIRFGFFFVQDVPKKKIVRLHSKISLARVAISCCFRRPEWGNNCFVFNQLSYRQSINAPTLSNDKLKSWHSNTEFISADRRLRESHEWKKFIVRNCLWTKKSSFSKKNLKFIRTIVTFLDDHRIIQRSLNLSWNQKAIWWVQNFCKLFSIHERSWMIRFEQRI